MTQTLQITFRHMPASPALESRIRSLAAALARACTDIVRCHVVIEAPSPIHPQGGVYRARLEITMPRHGTAAGRTHVLHQVHEDAYVALRDVFSVGRRQLEALEGAGGAEGRGAQPGTVHELR